MLPSPTLLAVLHTPCQTTVPEAPQFQNEPYHSAVTAVSPSSDFPIHFSNLPVIQGPTLEYSFIFPAHSLARSWKLLSAVYHSLCYFIPTVKPMTQIWVLAIGSLPGFLIPPPILLFVANYHHIRHPKTTKPTTGYPFPWSYRNILKFCSPLFKAFYDENQVCISSLSSHTVICQIVHY